MIKGVEANHSAHSNIRIDGIFFRSKLEAATYLLLKEMQARSIIRELDVPALTKKETHCKFDLLVGGRQLRTLKGRPATLSGDFSFVWSGDTVRTVIDVKGRTNDDKYQIFHFKSQLVALEQGVFIKPWTVKVIKEMAKKHDIDLKALVCPYGLGSTFGWTVKEAV